MSEMIPDPLSPRSYLVASGTWCDGLTTTAPVMAGVHHESSCVGRPCVVHQPSGHHMRSWPLHWRDDVYLMERLCSHGIGHPDPDDAAYQLSSDRAYVLEHACDGCCAQA